MAKKVKRCKHCNAFGVFKLRSQKLDPKGELCDKCYMKLDGPDKFKMILEVGVEITVSSAEEVIKYIESLFDRTLEMKLIDMQFEIDLNQVAKEVLFNKCQKCGKFTPNNLGIRPDSDGNLWNVYYCYECGQEKGEERRSQEDNQKRRAK